MASGDRSALLSGNESAVGASCSGSEAGGDDDAATGEPKADDASTGEEEEEAEEEILHYFRSKGSNAAVLPFLRAPAEARIIFYDLDYERCVCVWGGGMGNYPVRVYEYVFVVVSQGLSS